MHKIDISTWNRRAPYEHYSQKKCPFFQASFMVDVTPLYNYTKAHGLPFYYSMIHTTTKALNSVENFRHRIRGEEVWLIDRIDPHFSSMEKGAEVYKVTTYELLDDMAEFCEKAKDFVSRQTEFLDGTPVASEDEIVYISCLPTLDVTSIGSSHDQDPDDCVPIITWGKMTHKDGRRWLNLSIEVNHRTIDGFHVCRFGENLQALIDGLA